MYDGSRIEYGTILLVSAGLMNLLVLADASWNFAEGVTNQCRISLLHCF